LTVDTSLLPRRTLVPGQLLYRVHRADRTPWYYSTEGSGRFDTTVTQGGGTCYFAEDPLGAWVESFRTVMVIEQRDLLRRALTTVQVDRELDVADLADRRALRAGVTAATTGGADYSEPQALADSLHGLFDGVRWRVRHDLEQVLIGIALFGPAGRQPRAEWLPTRTSAIPAALARAAEDQFGYRVAPIP
jgi:hypothetical protein